MLLYGCGGTRVDLPCVRLGYETIVKLVCPKYLCEKMSNSSQWP